MELFTWLCLFIGLIASDFVPSEAAKLKPDNLHLRMKRSELERYFGVISNEEVPEYEVISPIQVDEDGRFLSHNLNIHAGQKRHAEEPRIWYYNVQAFGLSLHLNLTMNEELMSPWLTVERHENGTVTSEDPPHNSYFYGHVNSESRSSVAVSNEGGLTGIIQLLDQTLLLQPLASHLVSDSNRGNHVVYRRSVEASNTGSHYEEFIKANARKDTTFGEKSDKRIKRSDDDDHKYLEMTLVADKYTIEFHGETTAKYLLMLANLLNVIYHHESIGEKKITISVAQIRLVKDELDYSPISGNPTKISALKNWAKTANIPASDKHPNHPDVISLISRGGIGGYADFNSICKGSDGISFTVNNDMGFATVYILAHETAHTLGVSHDGSSASCPNYQRVMASVIPGGALAGKWSSCSRQKIQALLSNGPSCLEDTQRRRISYMKVFQNNLPGKLKTGDEQCRQQYGEGHRHCKQMQSDCGSLYCTKNGQSCYSKVAPPLDGTYCAPRHWCISGECVDDGSQIINGGWSKWSKSYTACSQTCGGGIQWKARTCTDPRPQNGGEDCEGELRGLPRICNTKPCPTGSKKYRDVQCEALNAAFTSYYRGGNDACKLYCRQGFTYWPKGLVKDGTRCLNDVKGHHDICVGGKCMPVGCDYQIGSGSMFDRCGVCNGDSTKCTQVIENYTNDWREKGVDKADLACVIPKGSTRIRVEEKAFDWNALGVQDAKKNYLIKPPKAKKIDAAGSTITYGKSSHKEYVEIPGPINQPLRFMFIYNSGKNKGIVCKYLKPQKSTITSKDVEWIIDEDKGWSACSESCAGGTKIRKVKCRRKDDKSIVKDAICEQGSKKPQDEMSCNTQPCSAEWHLTGWSSCSKTCGRGVITRKLSCRMKVKNPEDYQTVSERSCKGPKPTVLQKVCFKQVCPAEWVPTPWGKCSKSCGGGVVTRSLSCKKMGSDGQYHSVPENVCKNSVKPPVYERCNYDVPCYVKKYRALGCYKENPDLPVFEHSFRGSGLNWHKIEVVVDQCYQIVRHTKYKIFGVKFYGECWVGHNPGPEFKTSLDQCYEGSVGKAHTYYIYEIL